ncbi:MAG: hypothetical protein U0P81_15165 [Holophagaceae bacterium]
MDLPARDARVQGSLGLKVSLGCGVLLLLFLVTCGSFTWMAKRQAEAAADLGWAQLRGPLDRVLTEEGARGLYRDSPALRSRYGSEEGFVERARSWKPRLERLPRQRPGLRDLLGPDGSRFRIRTEPVKGQPRTWIRYAPPGGAAYTVEYGDGKVVDLDVQ